MQLTGCNLLGNISAPTAFPTFVGDTTTSIVGCLPLNINQVYADQLTVYSGSFLSIGSGSSSTQGVKINIAGLGIGVNPPASNSLEVSNSIGVGSAPSGVVGEIDVGTVNAAIVSASSDLKTVGTATTHLTASGGIAMSGGITVVSGGITVTGGLDIDNIAITGSLYNPAATGGPLGAGTINVATSVNLNGSAYTFP
jgi:hypothetical protein